FRPTPNAGGRAPFGGRLFGFPHTAFLHKKSGRTRLSAKIIGKSRNGKGVFCLILQQNLSIYSPHDALLYRAFIA
ncbi:MAG: hypothetical protein ACOCM2_01130, partial [Bacteroidales bacterium]